MKKVKIIAIVVLIVAVAVISIVVYTKLQSNQGDDELKISKTANVIEEIKKISEFTTYCFYEELLLRETKKSDSWFSSNDEIAIIAKGKVRAGFDLSKLNPDEILIAGDTLDISLDSAEIFDVIANPSDFDIFIENGEWSHEQVTEIEKKARTQLEKDAIKNDILVKATEVGVDRLTNFFKAFGFNTVTVNIKEPVSATN